MCFTTYFITHQVFIFALNDCFCCLLSIFYDTLIFIQIFDGFSGSAIAIPTGKPSPEGTPFKLTGLSLPHIYSLHLGNEGSITIIYNAHYISVGRIKIESTVHFSIGQSMFLNSIYMLPKLDKFIQLTSHLSYILE